MLLYACTGALHSGFGAAFSTSRSSLRCPKKVCCRWRAQGSWQSHKGLRLRSMFFFKHVINNMNEHVFAWVWLYSTLVIQQEALFDCCLCHSGIYHSQEDATCLQSCAQVPHGRHDESCATQPELGVASACLSDCVCTNVSYPDVKRRCDPCHCRLLPTYKNCDIVDPTHH